MSEKFIDKIKEKTNWKKTENNADALKSTNSALLDLFSTGGSLRNNDNESIENKVTKAWDESPEKTLKILFYLRDIRGGQGERRTFRVAMRHLAFSHAKTLEKIVHLIPEYGRWDDFYCLFDTPLEKEVIIIMKKQFEKDLENVKTNKTVSLLGKWLKGLGSRGKSLKLALKTRDAFGLNNKEYRQSLSLLRKKLQITERLMSDNDWDSLNFESIPSNAMMKYRNTFLKRLPEKFETYLDDVESGDKKINAASLYPYDPIKMMVKNNGMGYSEELFVYDSVAESQWKNLPDYFDGEHNALVMVDTSGSMTWKNRGNVVPLFVGLGIGLYLAERNSGPYKNKIITFSSKPSFVELKGTTLYERIKLIPSIIENTDIEKAMDLILNVAVEEKLEQSEIPETLIIISDMEFDQGLTQLSEENYQEYFVRKFENMGYKAPVVVYWNVEARNNTFHAKENFTNTILVSGSSPVIIKSILGCSVGITPIDIMNEVIGSKRYEEIKI